MSVITFTVRGTPAPQGSKRAFRNRHSGRIALVESSRRVAPWRSDVRDAAVATIAAHPEHGRHSAIPFHGPVAVDLAFRLPRPKGHYGSGRNARVLRPSAPLAPAGKPDLDKLVRAVFDALSGLVWADDAQVVALYTEKLYADEGFPAGVEVRVRERWATVAAELPARRGTRWPPVETPAQALEYIDALWAGELPPQED